MFKFEGKVRDLHELNCKVDEVHKFSTYVNDVHEFSKKIIDLHLFKSKIIDLHGFVVNALDLIVIKLTSFKESFHSKFSINEENIKLLSKGRFDNVVKSTVDIMSGIKAKARIENITNADIKMTCYQAKSRKLTSYNDMKLNEIPTRLKSCCFDFSSDNWSELASDYTSWDNLKTNIPTWEDLIK